MKEARKICVIGTGYVGLVTGACFADLGNRVTCVDTDTGRIASLRAGKMPFYEPSLAGSLPIKCWWLEVVIC
jgi:UDPglucose 6-dehydrogenase